MPRPQDVDIKALVWIGTSWRDLQKTAERRAHRISTPRQDIELIRERLKRAQEFHENWTR